MALTPDDPASDEEQPHDIGRSGFSPYATGGGGVTFERRVAVHYLAILLARDGAQELGDGRTISSVRFQQSHLYPVDDLVIRAGRRDEEWSHELTIAVRRAPKVVKSDKEMLALMRSLIETLRAFPDDDRDRGLVLAVAGSQPQAKQVGELAEQARSQASAADFFSLLGGGGFQKALTDRLTHVRGLVRDAMIAPGDPAPVDRDVDEATWSVLAHLQVRMFNLEGIELADWDLVANRLKLLSRSGDLDGGERLRDRLTSLVDGFAPRAATVDLPMLRRLLENLLRPVSGRQTLASLETQAELAKGTRFAKLLDAVEEEFGAEAGSVGLTFLQHDDELSFRIRQFLIEPSTWQEAEIIRLIAIHVEPRSDDDTAESYAGEIARAIRRNGDKTQSEPLDAIVRDTQGTGNRTEFVFLSADWLPLQARNPYLDLAGTNGQEAHNLEKHLKGNDISKEIRNLIKRPPRWVVEGSAELWLTLSEIAQTWGQLQLAEDAALEASERPGADCARLLARASELARVGGATDRGLRWLEDARQLDPEHPAVLVAQSLAASDPAARLSLLDGVDPLDARQGATIERVRTLALLELGRDEDAAHHAALAVGFGTGQPAIRELGPIVAIVANSRRDEPDVVELRSAAADLEALRAEIIELSRYGESARLRAAIAQAYLLAGDSVRAGRVLDALTEEETEAVARDEALAAELSRTAINAQRPDLADKRFLPVAGDGDFANLLRAQIAFFKGEASRSVVAFDQLLASSDADVATQAATFRLIVSLSDDAQTWSETAESQLRQSDPATADILLAERTAKDGDLQRARSLLVPLSDDPRALRGLADLAEQEGDLDAAIQIAASIVIAKPAAEGELRLAELLSAAGRQDEGRQILNDLRQDATAPDDSKAEAYGRLAEIAWERNEFSELVALTEDWLRFRPGSPAAAWARVLGLAVLSRYEDALAVIDELDLKPRNEQDARVAAPIYLRSLSPADALRRLIALSDRFDRTIEFLEAMVIYAGLGPEARDLPEDLQRRRSETWREFAIRFPDSQFIRAIRAPETAEEIEAFLREHVARGAVEAQELHKDVREGKAATAVLAAFLGKQIVDIWNGMGFLPVAFADSSLSALEKAAALDALGKAAVWESSAMYVAGGLGEDLKSLILRSLPGSTIPQSVLDDAAAGAAGPFRSDEDGVQLGWDVAGDRGRITTIPAAEQAIRFGAAEGMLEIARGLKEVPDTHVSKPGRFDELLIERTMAECTFRTWAASYSVAERLSLPIYSDDRYLRLHAHGAGLKTFGTIALLEALEERGLLATAAHQLAVRRLRVSGALGLAPAIDDLVEEAKAANWELDHLVGYALNDPTAWRSAPEGYLKHTQFLRAVLQNAPEKLQIWTARIVDVASRTLENESEGPAPWILAMA